MRCLGTAVTDGFFRFPQFIAIVTSTRIREVQTNNLFVVPLPDSSLEERL